MLKLTLLTYILCLLTMSLLLTTLLLFIMGSFKSDTTLLLITSTP
jgi:hypothetical protein